MVHLHVRSCYSLLESPFRIDQIIQSALDNHHSHVCLTDHHSMYATMEFIKKARANHLHPIVGMEVDVKEEEFLFTFVLLAQNDQGLQELYRLSSTLMKGDTMSSMEELSSKTPNCVALTAGGDDAFFQWVSDRNKENILEFFSRFEKCWNHHYISIAMNDSKYRLDLHVWLKEVAKEMGLPTVALSRVFYQNKEDIQKLKILRAIDTQKTIHDLTLDSMNNRYYRSDAEMNELYDLEDLKQTETIASMCNIQMAFPKSNLPEFHNNLGIDNTHYLIKLCKAGLMKRCHNNVSKEYVQRLEYECSVITSMGFTNYFLIVWDFIRKAKSENIYIGPGRGSAAGSLVAYCLGITHIDPIQNNLLFERFLNPERISMPDIDTDFPDNRRDEVIDYVREKYGDQHVAHIVTFNTLRAKQALRDVGRTMRIATRVIDEFCNQIPNDPKATLSVSYQQNPRLKQLIERENMKEFFRAAMSVEGLPRHTSVHAAGIVLSDQEITNVCPLVQLDENVVATQFTMEHLEELGLIKMDFLGLRNLTIIDSIVTHIEKDTGQRIEPLKIPLNDQKTFMLLSRADTMGVFQLESSGIQKLLMDMKPNRFEDICAVLALYRPGPMQNIPLYLKNREDPSQIKYIDPRLEPILRETYGVIVYQEQIMMIAQVIGGFSLGQADTLRKAMSKKDASVMAGFKETFIQGAIRNSVSTKNAEEIFALMERFAQYGFNKSHSYAYSMIAYQLAYLKTNYPVYFYQAILNSVKASESKTSQYIYECQRRQIPVLTPDVNYSQPEYAVQDKALRMPLSVMKGVGKQAEDKVLNERKNGLYTSFENFIIRSYINKVSESAIRTFICGGALDGFQYNRTTMFNELSRAMEYASLSTKFEGDKEVYDEEMVSPFGATIMKEDKAMVAQKEKEVFGFYLSEHPIQTLRKSYPKASSIYQCLQVKDGYVQVLGQITGFRAHKTKNGDWMCFLSIEDESAAMDVAVMPKLYQAQKDNIKRGATALIYGKKERTRQQSMLADKIQWIEPYQ